MAEWSRKRRRGRSLIRNCVAGLFPFRVKFYTQFGSNLCVLQVGEPAQEIDLSDENLSREQENGLDGEVREEIQQVQEDTEIVVGESNSEPVEKFDQNSRRNPDEISMHDVDSEPVDKFDQNSKRNPDEVSMQDMENEHVEKSDQNSSRKPVEITTHDMDNEHVEKSDQNSSRKPVEITTHDMVTVRLLCSIDSEIVEKGDENSTKNDIKNENSSKNDIENENSSQNNIKKEMPLNDNEDLETSDQSTISIRGPVISLIKHSIHSDGPQEAESMENTPTAQLMMHQEQLLDDMAMDTVAETAEAELGEGTVTDKDVPKQEEQKAMAEPVELVGSPPALPSLVVKPREMKVPELPGLNETGMKIEQDVCSKKKIQQDDFTNGELVKEQDLMSKAGAMPGGAVMSVDRWSASMAILALMFAVTIGITIAVRLYALPRATKLQMDSQ